MSVDFARTARDYAAYRAGFPDALFSRLGELTVGVERQRVLDLGTGTGALARGFAHRGCVVKGPDPALAMLEQASRLDHQAGVQVSYRWRRKLDGSTGISPLGRSSKPRCQP